MQLKERSTTTTQVENGGIKRGDVRGVREMKHGVQAQVSLGYVPGKGSASVTVVCHSPEVLHQLAVLKRLLAAEAFALVGQERESAA